MHWAILKLLINLTLCCRARECGIVRGKKNASAPNESTPPCSAHTLGDKLFSERGAGNFNESVSQLWVT